jgi:hypothetical protein
MSRFEKIKKYQRKKFLRYKELNDIKTKNDEAYIVVSVKDRDSIFSEYSSPERPMLKLEFLELIERRASFVPLDLPLVLEIQNNTFTSEEKILIRKLIKNHFSLKTISKEVEYDNGSRKGRFLFTAGVLCVALIPILEHIEKITFINEMLSVIACFSFWEYSGLKLFDHDELKEEIIHYRHLSNIRVIYDKDTNI